MQFPLRLFKFLTIVWFSAVEALSISFLPEGTPTAGLKSQLVLWKRDTSDPNTQFVLQKIKLNDPDGPTPKSTPVPILNSQSDEGESPMVFNQAGLFQIIAVDKQNEQTFFSTELTVLPNPTSSASLSSSNTFLSESLGSSIGTPTSLAGPAASDSDYPAATSSSTVGPSTVDSKNGNHTATIIGVTILGIVALISIPGVIFLCLRWRKGRHRTNFTASFRQSRNSQVAESTVQATTPVTREVARTQGDNNDSDVLSCATLVNNDARPISYAEAHLGVNEHNRSVTALSSTRKTQTNPVAMIFRHQDSGWRDLSLEHNQIHADMGMIGLPPDYETV
ncbi:hypothetical protein DFJ43DRAFT_1153449 [Lentinula guzmanii]|uniref:Mid2 domain-containing protein n=1 Tax=Lentinula guzmanii TaxID=2804957 RepID=A0AA38JNW4_9AGAR|nr:hypothetical protein DFJ43DRAFT_1153449 [Lentinula guzmanii]